MPKAGAGALVALLVGALLSCSAHDDSSLDVTGASPSRISARGGDTLTLRGSGFTSRTTVRVGGAVVQSLELVSSNEVRVVTPPLYAGPADVVAEASGSDDAKLPHGVEVLALDLRFVEAPPYALPAPPDATIAGAVLGDFDGDGDVDLISCAPGAPCRFLENDGRGNFTDSPDGRDGPRFPAAMPDSRAVVAADFDGNGDVDLFLGFASNGPGSVLRNDGAGSFVDVGPEALPADDEAGGAVAVGDLDGDGLPDLVIANAAGAAPLRVYRNTSTRGSIRFAAAPDGTVPAGDWIVSAIQLVDVDGDGDLDVVVATPGASDGVGIRLLLNEGGELHEAPGDLPAGSGGAITALAAGDVDGDGAPDLVAAGAGQDRLFLNDGTGHFFDATAGAMPVDASLGASIALVDLDRDRHPDLVIGNAGAETRLYLNDGTGRFLDHTPLLPIRADATAWVGVADVDGDADEDILIINAVTNPARLYLSVKPAPHDAP